MMLLAVHRILKQTTLVTIQEGNPLQKLIVLILPHESLSKFSVYKKHKNQTVFL